jgi:malonyl-CoA O-methyltransferase
MPTQTAELALPARRASRAAFERAAPSFAAACFVHDWARQRLLERLAFVRIAPDVVVDLGCATGKGAVALAQHFPSARVLALDASLAMLAAVPVGEVAPRRVAADAERLPLNAQAASLVLANLVLPWCRPQALFREAARVLAPGGLFMFATLGPDTLQEVRRAWASVDDRVHVHAAFDMHDLGDIAAAAGLREPVLDVDHLSLTYRDVRDLVGDLRACGGVNTAAGRRRALTGPARWRAFAAALYEGKRDARFAVTVELIFGQAWGGPGTSARSTGEVVIPLSRIGRNR